MTTAPDTRRRVDVCLVVEGCYPFVAGGVSTWLDWLIRNQPDLTFGAVAITADERPQTIKYELPPNLLFLERLPLARALARPTGAEPIIDRQEATDLMCRILDGGDSRAFA